MTAYSDFVCDFPKRCLDLLDLFSARARIENREVTLLLSVATTGFVIPFERLLPTETHPAQESQQYGKFAADLNAELSKPFSRLPISANMAHLWNYGEIDSATGDPDAWVPQCKGIGTRDARCILRVVRNALAHGAVFTRGESEIDQLVFLSQRREKDNQWLGRYRVVAVPPNAFDGFLRAWISKLQTAEAGKLLSDEVRRAA